jgi:hypothetical protein
MRGRFAEAATQPNGTLCKSVRVVEPKTRQRSM